MGARRVPGTRRVAIVQESRFAAMRRAELHLKNVQTLRIGGAGRRLQVHVPEAPHVFLRQSVACREMLHRWLAEAGIEGGIDQDLERHVVELAFAGDQRDRRREIATRALTAHRDRRNIRLPMQPQQGCERVFQPGREWVLGSKPVIHRRDEHVRGAAQGAAQVVRQLDAAERPAAAVHEHHSRKRWPGIRRVKPDPQRSRRSVDVHVAHRRNHLGRP